MLKEGAVLPKRSSKGAIGYDVVIPEDTVVYQGRNVVKLGFALELLPNCEAKIEPRSGFSAKGMKGKSLPDEKGHTYESTYDADVLVGKIDPDYRGEIGVIINNHDTAFILPKGTKVAQMTFYFVYTPDFIEFKELSQTERGDNGFGSTGTINN